MVFGPIWPGIKTSMMEDSFRMDLQCLAVWGEELFSTALIDGIALFSNCHIFDQNFNTTVLCRKLR